MKIFNCGFASFEKLAREDETVCASIKAPPWIWSSHKVAFLETKLKMKFHRDSGAETKIKNSSKSLAPNEHVMRKTLILDNECGNWLSKHD